MIISIFNLCLTALLGISVGLVLLGKVYGLPFIFIFIYFISVLLYTRFQNVFLYAVLSYLFFGNTILGALHLSIPFQSYLDEALTYGLLSLFLLHKSFEKKPMPTPGYKKYAFGLCLIIFVSACLNAISPVTFVNYTATLLKPFAILYMIAESEWNEHQLKRLIYFLIAIGLVEGCLIIGQVYSGLSLGLGEGDLLDIGTGSLGEGLQHHLGYLLLAIFFLTGFIFLYTKSFLFLILSIFSAVCLHLTHTYHVLVIIPLILFFLICFIRQKIPFLVIVFLLLIFPIAFFCAPQILGEKQLEKLNLDELKASGKFQSYQNLFLKLPKELHGGAIIGAGPGTYASKIASKNKAPLYEKYVYSIVANMSPGSRGSTFNFPWTSAIALWGELGPLGFILYFLSLMKLIGEVRSVIFSPQYSSFWRGAAMGSLCNLLFIAIMAFIVTAFEDMYMTYPIYMLGAIILALRRQEMSNGNRNGGISG